MATLWARLRREPFTVLAPALARVRREWLAVPAALCWLVAALILRHRLPYGVSHTDEAFYIAMPYEFLLGNRPYIDEIAIHQNAGLLLVPFVWVYLAIHKTADGIILFNRYLYWALALVSSLLTFRFVKQLAGAAVACCVGALIATFAYANIFALSYNTCGAFGFFCGTVCSATALLRPRPGPLLFAGCLCFLAAVFSYPGLLLVVPVYELIVLAWLYWKVPRASLRNGLLGLGAGVAVGVVVMGPLALWLGASGLHRLLAYMQSAGFAQTSSFGKLNVFNPSAFPASWAPVILGFAAIFVALPLACRFVPRGVWLLAPLLAYATHAFYAWGASPAANTSVAMCQMALPALAPVCVLLNKEWRQGSALLALVWAPSFLAMLCTVITSSNGYWAMSLGSLGVMVAGVTSFAALLRHQAQRKPSNQLDYGLVFATFFGLFLSAQVDSLFTGVYDVDTNFDTHTTLVSEGPFEGAIATAAESAFLTVIDGDLKSLEGKGETLTVFDDFATGYLSTHLRPRTFTPWIYWGLEGKYMARLMDATFSRPDQLPDFVLKIHLGAVTQQVWSKYERDLYRQILSRPEYHYAVFQRVALPVGPPPEQHHRKRPRH